MSPKFKKYAFYFSVFFLLPSVLALILYSSFNFFHEPPFLATFFIFWFVFLLFKTLKSFVNFDEPITKEDSLRDSFVFVYIFEYVLSLSSAYRPQTGYFYFNYIDSEKHLSLLQALFANMVPFPNFNFFTLGIPTIALIVFIAFMLRLIRSNE